MCVIDHPVAEYAERANFPSVWNTHSRINQDIARTHIEDLSKLTPPVSISSQYIPTSSASASTDGALVDLDTPDEEAIRSLVLGVSHRTLEDFATSRTFFEDAVKKQPQIKCSTWVSGVVLFELAVLDLKEVEADERAGKLSSETNKGELSHAGAKRWEEAIKSAMAKLDKAVSISGNEVDLSSRLDSRVMMLKDEITLKRETLMSCGTPKLR
jgi:hypothetical protein